MRFVAEHWTNARVNHADEEHFFERKQRALKALNHLVAPRERTVLVITHGTFLCMLIGCMMVGEEIIQKWFDKIRHFLVLKNTALSVCEYDQGQWQLVRWNDHTHLG
jgi:broad specificity phosphatase PhoE